MSDLTAILKQILRAEYLTAANRWIGSSNREEQKGLKLIGAIYRNKGEKLFRARAENTRRLNTAQSGRIRSTYQTEFSDNTKQSRNNIFEFRRLSDLECSKILNPVSLMFMENWISLKDEEQYQRLVLACLRSLFAVIRSSTSYVSETKNQFKWNDPSKNFSNQRVDLLTSSASRREQVFKPWERTKTAEPRDTRKEPTQPSSNNLKKIQVRDNGIFKNMQIGAAPVTSEYQRTYVTHFYQYMKQPPPDVYTSMSVGRLCPDPNIKNTR